MTSRLQQLLDTFDLKRPLEAARTIPASWYHDTENADPEVRRIFGRSWQAVGREAAASLFHQRLAESLTTA